MNGTASNTRAKMLVDGHAPASRSLLGYTALVTVAAILLIPIVWLLITSLKQNTEYLSYPIKFLPAVPRWENYAQVFAPVYRFMPHAWMDACHRWLGLGDLPETPVIVYLSRSLSAMYAYHGGLLWLAAADLRRYAAIVTYLGWAFLAFGAATLWIDCHAGLPWLWIAAEGPFAILVGLAILVLQRRAGQPRETSFLRPARCRERRLDDHAG